MDLEKQRLALGIAYINELRTTDIAECIDIVNSWLTNMYSTWIDIKYRGKMVGFLLIGFPPNVANGFNWYLQESYILPSYRKRGLMKSALINLFRTHRGKYCFYILAGNQKAFNFWQKNIPELGGKWIDDKCGLKDKDLVFYGFEV